MSNPSTENISNIPIFDNTLYSYNNDIQIDKIIHKNKFVKGFRDILVNKKTLNQFFSPNTTNIKQANLTEKLSILNSIEKLFR